MVYFSSIPVIPRICGVIFLNKFNKVKIVYLVVRLFWFRDSFFFLCIIIDIGDLDNGVDHLAKAVAVCSQPQSLMALFQQTLPAELFQEIIMRLPRIAQVCFLRSVFANIFFLFSQCMVHLHHLLVVVLLWLN
jgi:hypothetical protein